MESLHTTPCVNKFKKPLQESPMNIPPTPQLTKLGFGTGVGVYNLPRSPTIDGVSRSPWALKKISHNFNLKEVRGRLQKEAKILQVLDHPNIVGYRGFISKDNGKECLALEKCSTCLGTLKDERMENGSGPFPAKTILKVALEVAKGLDYLHREKHLLHGDIKSYNILIKDNFESIKLCDFGVSLPLSEDDTLNKDVADDENAGYIGTLSWSAPEIIADLENSISSKADIFSYGLTIWEMMTLGTPHFEDIENSMESTPSTNNSTLRSSDASSCEGSYYNPEILFGTRPAISKPLGEEYKPVIELFNSCTEQDPCKRPSAAEIIAKLSCPT